MVHRSERKSIVFKEVLCSKKYCVQRVECVQKELGADSSQRRSLLLHYLPTLLLGWFEYMHQIIRNTCKAGQCKKILETFTRRLAWSGSRDQDQGSDHRLGPFNTPWGPLAARDPQGPLRIPCHVFGLFKKNTKPHIKKSVGLDNQLLKTLNTHDLLWF